MVGFILGAKGAHLRHLESQVKTQYASKLSLLVKQHKLMNAGGVLPEGMPPEGPRASDSDLQLHIPSTRLSAVEPPAAPERKTIDSMLKERAAARFARAASPAIPSKTMSGKIRINSLTRLSRTARVVQTTTHLQRKVTKQRQGLLEGKHASLPQGLPPGEDLASRGSSHLPSNEATI